MFYKYLIVKLITANLRSYCRQTGASALSDRMIFGMEQLRLRTNTDLPMKRLSRIIASHNDLIRGDICINGFGSKQNGQILPGMRQAFRLC